MKPLGVLLLVCGALFLMTLSVTVGQTSRRNQDAFLVGKFEKAIRAKEPKYNLSLKRKRKEGKDYDYTTIEWKKGSDFVHIETVEFDTVEEAVTWLNDARNAPVSVIKPTTRLTDLGDEASLIVSADGFAMMFIRKGRTFLRLEATSSKLAMRFARHLVNSIDS